MSDDGASSLVLIALRGNVFSPRRARALARGEGGSPLDFSAMNLALEGRDGSAWVMTEHAAAAVLRSEDGLAVGRSDLRWNEGTLVARIDERTAPWGRRTRGVIRFTPTIRTSAEVDLSGDGRHRWFPHAPFGRIEVDFAEPAFRFVGHGYFDANEGTEPLEDRFHAWSWSRFGSEGGAALAYDVELRDGTRRSCGLRVAEDGTTSALETGAELALGRSRFGLGRRVWTETGALAELVRTVEDGPFYVRSLVRSELGGRPAVGMHEAVSLARFRAPWVRFLVPFRMRVEAGR